LIENKQLKIIYRVLISETYENIEKAMKYYGNSTHPGSHFILNAYLISLRQESVSMYIELISQILAEYSSDKWPNWTVSMTINLLQL
jgi:hypothetical protein